MPTSPQTASPATPQRHAPRNLWHLFTTFTVIALQGFGGVLAIVQRELVEKRGWLTNQEFIEDWSVAQIMPGPNVVNLSITLGDRYFGWRGALAASLGMLLVPMLLVIALAVLYNHWSASPAVAGAVRGMAAVAAGLVAGTACKLAASLRSNPLGLWAGLAFAAAAMLALAWLHWPLAWVLLGLGGASYALVYARLAPARAAAAPVHKEEA
ncbi:chromate transporter [Comamonas odontotermitis]|uniref:Chromate transporter n=1 Tax=Comamonas odontotermitis TaxID=379895 RepID=A0ABR6RJ38_9BURK|nr:chromate transporter [Comamonas odontotermitis]MBB6579191.1 chromate transporter [Comamonas odontotermitis]